jgi:hypothetical protein
MAAQRVQLLSPLLAEGLDVSANLKSPEADGVA